MALKVPSFNLIMWTLVIGAVGTLFIFPKVRELVSKK